MLALGTEVRKADPAWECVSSSRGIWQLYWHEALACDMHPASLHFCCMGRVNDVTWGDLQSQMRQDASGMEQRRHLRLLHDIIAGARKLQAHTQMIQRTERHYQPLRN